MLVTPTTAVLGDPTGARAAAVMVKYAAPADVLAAPTVDLFGAPRLACNFADRRMRYPIHTKAAAWTSAAGYLDAGGGDPETEARIKGALAYHRLPAGEWDRLERVAAAGRPPVRSPEKYALPAVRRYPLDTPDQVKAAAAYFQKYASRFDPDSRRTFAANLVAAAGASLPATVTARIEAEAGMAMPNPLWRSEFDKRAALASDPGLRAAIIKAAAEVAAVGFPGGTFSTAGEVAELLRQVDRAVGWDFPDPLPGLTGETPSTARAKLAQAVEAATGDWYAAADLDRVPDAEFVGLFGGGPVVSRATKAAALRDPDRAPILTGLLQDYGVGPVSRARPRTDWAALAGGVVR